MGLSVQISYKNIDHTRVVRTLLQHDLILTYLVTSVMAMAEQGHNQRLRVRTLTREFWGDATQLITVWGNTPLLP